MTNIWGRCYVGKTLQKWEDAPRMTPQEASQKRSNLSKFWRMSKSYVKAQQWGREIQAAGNTDARAWKHEPGGVYRKLQAFDVAAAWRVYEDIERNEAWQAGRPWQSTASYTRFRFLPWRSWEVNSEILPGEWLDQIRFVEKSFWPRCKGHSRRSWGVII